MKHTCPHCGEKTFSPIRKALAGGMTSNGQACPSCGGRCVNGKLSLIVNSITLLPAMVLVFITYFRFDTMMDVVKGGLIPLLAAIAFNYLFNAFFGKLIPAIRKFK